MEERDDTTQATNEVARRLGRRAGDALILVDGRGEATGEASMAACHTPPGLLHRAFSVYLFDDAGRLLLHRRAPAKALWGGFWTNSCCSHPRAGEQVAAAAMRRVAEELGLRADAGGGALEPLFEYAYRAEFEDVGVEHEHVHVFRGRCEPAEIAPDPDEMDAVRWLAPDEVDALIAGNEPTTPWFELAWPRVR